MTREVLLGAEILELQRLHESPQPALDCEFGGYWAGIGKAWCVVGDTLLLWSLEDRYARRDWTLCFGFMVWEAVWSSSTLLLFGVGTVADRWGTILSDG